MFFDFSTFRILLPLFDFSDFSTFAATFRLFGLFDFSSFAATFRLFGLFDFCCHFSTFRTFRLFEFCCHFSTFRLFEFFSIVLTLDPECIRVVPQKWKAVWVEGGEDFIPVKRWSKDRVPIKRHNGTVHSTPTCRIVELTYTVLHTDSPLTHWPTSVFSHIAFHIT